MNVPHVAINRHFIILTSCFIIVFALGVVSNKAWHSQVVTTQARAARQVIIQNDTKRRQAKAVAAEQARLKTECDKEVAYYNSLTATQKAKQSAPACQNLQQIQ